MSDETAPNPPSPPNSPRVQDGLLVNEVYCSIQGEGTRAGRPSVFIRLAGCPLRCVWCDTAYAFHGGMRRSCEDLVAQAGRFPIRLVCLTGGEPLAQPEAYRLVEMLGDRGFEVVVETSGHLLLDRLDRRAVVVMDLKAPGSGEVERNEWRNLELLKANDEVKIVLADRADYEWARQVVLDRGLDGRCASVLFSPVHPGLSPAELSAWILQDGLPVRMQLQLHKYIWPGVERGV